MKRLPLCTNRPQRARSNPEARTVLLDIRWHEPNCRWVDLRTDDEALTGLTLESRPNRARYTGGYSEREVLQGIWQAQVLVSHQDQGLALFRFRALVTLLAELRQVRLQALNFSEGDVQGLTRGELGHVLLVPSGLEGQGVCLGREVDERIAQVRLAICGAWQIQEVELPGVLPLFEQHLLSVHHRHVAHHQGRLALPPAHLGRVLGATLVGFAELVVEQKRRDQLSNNTR